MFNGVQIKPGMRVVQAEGLVAADMDEEKVMMSIGKGKYYNIDPVGSFIWGLMEKPIYVKSLVDILLQEYDVEEGECKLEVIEFLNKMLREGLVSSV